MDAHDYMVILALAIAAQTGRTLASAVAGLVRSRRADSQDETVPEPDPESPEHVA